MAMETVNGYDPKWRQADTNLDTGDSGALDFTVQSESFAQMKYLQYRVIAWNMFRWTGLPAGLRSDMLERMLCEYGAVSWFITDLGHYILPFTHSSGGLNVYGEPITVTAVPLAGSSPLLQVDYTPRILWDNSTHDPFNIFLRNFSHRLGQIQRRIMLVERQAGAPTVALVDEFDKASYARIQTAIDQGKPFIPVDKTTDLSRMQIWDTGFKPETLKMLWEDANKVEGELYTLLGTMFNVEQNKAAGVGAAEMLTNYAQTYAFADSRHDLRLRWCELINSDPMIAPFLTEPVGCEKADNLQELIDQLDKAEPDGRDGSIAAGASTAASVAGNAGEKEEG